MKPNKPPAIQCFGFLLNVLTVYSNQSVAVALVTLETHVQDTVLLSGRNWQHWRQLDLEYHHSWQQQWQQWPTCGPPHH